MALRPKKILVGTRDLKGNVTLHQPEGGTGRIRCMKCQNLCTPQRRADGSQTMKCGACGAEYSSRPM